MEKRQIRKLNWRGKRYTYYHDMIKFIEEKYDIQERGFLDSNIFKTGANTLSTLAQDKFEELLVLAQTTRAYLDFWHWYLKPYEKSGAINHGIRTKKFNFDNMIKRAIKEKTWKAYSTDGISYITDTSWIIAILKIMKLEFGNEVNVSFEWALF